MATNQMHNSNQMHYPTIAKTDTPVLLAANMVTPPDGFEPERDGAATWLAMRMQRSPKTDG